jgi:hypothetical protein
MKHIPSVLLIAAVPSVSWQREASKLLSIWIWEKGLTGSLLVWAYYHHDEQSNIMHTEVVLRAGGE